MATIAVYGTLRKGHALNDYLKNSRYIGKYRLNGFNLYMSPYIPFVEKGNGKIIVELYEITDNLLKTLDIIEGSYKRIPVKVGKHNAFIYIGKSFLKEGATKIETGDFNDR